MAKKVGLITSKKRSKAFTQALKDYELSVSIDEQSMRETLSAWDQAGYEAAVIDDAGIENKTAMVDAMRFIANAPRDKQARLRAIFLASSTRAADDDIFYTLAESGVYDLVKNEQDPITPLLGLIENPAKRGDVITYLNRVEIDPPNVTDLRSSPAEGATTKNAIPDSPTPTILIKETQEKLATLPLSAPSARPDQTSPMPKITPEMAAAKSQVRKTVGVIGPYPRAGATNLAQTVARSAVLAGHRVALLINGAEFKRMKKLYADDYVEEEKRIRVSGIDFILGYKPDFPASINYDYIVIDFGAFVTTNEKNEFLAYYNKTDIHLVQIPLGSPSEAQLAAEWIAAQDLDYLSQMTIITYSSIQAVHDRLEREVATKSPKTKVVMRGYQPWPLSLTGIPDSINQTMNFVKGEGTSKAKKGWRK